jgi:hypothetical protein
MQYHMRSSQPRTDRKTIRAIFYKEPAIGCHLEFLPGGEGLDFPKSKTYINHHCGDICHRPSPANPFQAAMVNHMAKPSPFQPVVSLLGCALATATPVSSAVISVPEDAATIQNGIDLALDGGGGDEQNGFRGRKGHR